MTAKQFLDAFSETLMQDERILTPRERELLLSILQNSRNISGNNHEIESAVNAAISRSVGEAVAQRAFALLGGSIVEQILSQASVSFSSDQGGGILAQKGPQPPAKRGPLKDPPPAPQPPSVSDIYQHSGAEDSMASTWAHKTPQPPAKRGPLKDPPPAPQPPSITQAFQTSAARDGVASGHSKAMGVLDLPGNGRAQCVVLDEFLAPQELEELISYTLLHENEFQSSRVVAPTGEAGMVDYTHRRSRVLMNLGKHEQVVLERIRGVLPSVLEQLGMTEFPVTQTEAQITASNDGDFFGEHRDNSEEMIASRRLTFVYFFHREPRQFEGGELRMHDSRESSRIASYQAITPQQNQIVFFPCSVLHEITAVECRSQAFADGRFTLNGWLHN
jgi:hypothetical protein